MKQSFSQNALMNMILDFLHSMIYHIQSLHIYLSICIRMINYKNIMKLFFCISDFYWIIKKNPLVISTLLNPDYPGIEA